MPTFKFNNVLQKGIIIDRPNRFTMLVKSSNSIIKCYCPSTARIGNLTFKEVPCLFSKSNSIKNKTSYTVEAISIDTNNKNNSWIGINQTKANSYMEYFLNYKKLPEIFNSDKNILREKYIGNSRIDFLTDNCVIEVKTFLSTLPSVNNSFNNNRNNLCNRFIKQYKDIIINAELGYRSIIILCFLYNATLLNYPILPDYNEKLVELVKKAVKIGVEHWQVNLKINQRGVDLIKYFKIV